MKRIETQWVSYRHLVMPVDAPSIQVQECRRAFYAGAEAFLREVTLMLSPGGEPTDSDEEKMQAMHDELHDFAKKVKEGKA